MSAKSNITNGNLAGDEPDLVVPRLVLASRYVLDSTHVVLSLFIIATCLTGLTTGLILPFLNRHLHDWLYR